MGICTWSRGGGWGGPYIKNEFWVELNAYVMSHWASNPLKTEKEILYDFAKAKGLPESEWEMFRRLCLLSEDGVIKGQYSAMGDTYVNWTRDDTITGDVYQKSYFDRMIERNQVNAYLKEKEEAVRIWKEIEQISQKLHFPSEELNHFIRTSCSYGRIKYELFSVSWQIMLCGYVADTTKKPFNRVEMDKYITIFDSLWKEWNDLSKENDDCPSLYKISSNFFGFPVGIQETVDKYRK